jgi:hypothetical protein
MKGTGSQCSEASMILRSKCSIHRARRGINFANLLGSSLLPAAPAQAEGDVAAGRKPFALNIIAYLGRRETVASVEVIV